MTAAQICEKQKLFYQSGKTRQVGFRIHALSRLRAAIQEMEPEILEALRQDLGKSSFEGYMCEIGMVQSEISHMLRHVRAYSRTKPVVTPIAQFCSMSYVKKEPYGAVLIMSPWNYPFMLTLEPLVDALAAGNTAVVKPSAYAPHTSAVIRRLLEGCFPQKYVAVIEGGRDVNADLLEQKWDYIFFTGSRHVGRLVMEKAAAHLTPVTLELGGKSPCIVDETANLKITARRIAFGKYLNCGQTCVAPDYLLVHRSVKDELLTLLRREIRRMYGENPLENPAYGKIINEKHFQRLRSLIKGERVICGGVYNDRCQIAPTILDSVSPFSPVMQEEIFGPILPVLTYEDLDAAVEYVKRQEKPLACYYFSTDRARIRRLTSELPFGGGCVNDTIIHLATSAMGFGGVGESGMGSYHGKKGFDTFTHEKSIVDKMNWIDLPMRYQPGSQIKDLLVRAFLK